MVERWRVAVFFIVVLSIWTLMHVFALWRLWAVPALEPLPRPLLVGLFLLLWLAFPLGRILDHRGLHAAGAPLELAGATWMGVLFLLIVALLAADLLTGFGRFAPQLAPSLRGWAAAAALVLALIAIAQAMRTPVVRDHEVRLTGLPAERDGTVLVQLSDMHLGSILGREWLAARIAQVEALRPDLVLVTGDLVDGNAAHVEDLVPDLQRLQAPLGVWAVTGNHEFYAGLERSVALLERSGFRLLRDAAEEVVPGLVLAGVDDLTARLQLGLGGRPLEQALGNGRPDGAVVLLSHSPLKVDQAAALGAGLMLSGHTHDGQIWPFNLIVKYVSYSYIGGRYEVGPMTLLVSRGTGTWGPRMRLWRPSEILRVTLRSAA